MRSYSSTHSNHCRIDTLCHPRAAAQRSALNTRDGKMYTGSALQKKFEDSETFCSLLILITTESILEQRQFIVGVVRNFFAHVMISHRWEDDELAFERIKGQNVYDLPASRFQIIRGFCRQAAMQGFDWRGSTHAVSIRRAAPTYQSPSRPCSRGTVGPHLQSSTYPASRHPTFRHCCVVSGSEGAGLSKNCSPQMSFRSTKIGRASCRERVLLGV